MPEPYPQFFLRVTGNDRGILPFQERYGRNPFESTILIIPTGLGKTDTVLVPWLYAQVLKSPSAPRRLVVILPRKNLTEQTAGVARDRVNAAGLSDRVKVLELMGGSRDNAETLEPDQRAIIVCTQDLYFSRALNRGYARRPPRWPIDFALFNNDCQLVFDEVQLMSDGLATSTQLAAFREQFGVFGSVPCVWMSATMNLAWLDTVDFRGMRARLRRIGLEADDLQHEIVAKRYHSRKRLERAPDECATPRGCAEFALSRHRPGERTLIVVNTVDRAREIYAELKKQETAVVLLHSRFRPGDRREQVRRLLSKPDEGQIVVSTQVLEAGIDLSSHRLITDIAPWGSLVQRFGRANRYGELSDGAEIWWVEQPLRSKVKGDDVEKLFAPYDPSDVAKAKAKLTGLLSAAPAELPDEDGPAPWKYVLRRADLMDLFDTSPDLSGNDIDVSRFIRAGEDKDVYIAWREWTGDSPSHEEIQDEELCPVPLFEAREFLKRHTAYRWDYLRGGWVFANSEGLFPGLVLLLSSSEGGYRVDEGWMPTSKGPTPPTVGAGEMEDDTSDKLSFLNFRQTLRDHTEAVVRELSGLISELKLAALSDFRADLDRAAVLHDWGKAHEVMQETLRGDEQTNEILAKSTGRRRHKRKYFRHELASALAMLETGESDLAAYVVAAHHGRVRMSIRSMPGEPDGCARGIRDGDVLPGCETSAGVFAPEVKLSLDRMKLGEGSWADRMLRLLDRLGPFRLAYLELLLRAADARASALAEKEAAVCAQH